MQSQASVDDFDTWCRKYEMYIIDEMKRGATRSELARELINTAVDPDVSKQLLIIPPHIVNDDGDLNASPPKISGLDVRAPAAVHADQRVDLRLRRRRRVADALSAVGVPVLGCEALGAWLQEAVSLSRVRCDDVWLRRRRLLHGQHDAAHRQSPGHAACARAAAAAQSLLREARAESKTLQT